MITYSGQRVYVEGTGVPTLYDIGVSQGRIARFNGHTQEWYPVLAHSLVVARLAPDFAALHALVHDAPEVCCSDVPTPWKTQAARNREERLLERMYHNWELEWPIPEDIENAVKVADMQALTAEYHVLNGAEPTTGRSNPRWESPLFVEPDPVAVQLTNEMLAVCQQFLRADVAGPMFEEAFSHYTQVQNEYHKRERRNAAARERRRANAAGAGVG